MLVMIGCRGGGGRERWCAWWKGDYIGTLEEPACADMDRCNIASHTDLDSMDGCLLRYLLTT